MNQIKQIIKVRIRHALLTTSDEDTDELVEKHSNMLYSNLKHLFCKKIDNLHDNCKNLSLIQPEAAFLGRIVVLRDILYAVDELKLNFEDDSYETKE